MSTVLFTGTGTPFFEQKPVLASTLRCVTCLNDKVTYQTLRKHKKVEKKRGKKTSFYDVAVPKPRFLGKVWPLKIRGCTSKKNKDTGGWADRILEYIVSNLGYNICCHYILATFLFRTVQILSFISSSIRNHG